MKPGLLKTEQHVVSAEGTRYRVLYVYAARGEEAPEAADLAEVHPDGSWRFEERTTLPTAELRRVAASKRVEVTGIPEGERPRCVKCNKPLRVQTRDTWGPGGRVVARVFERWQGYTASVDRARPERFCTVACMQWFARRAFDAGYRMVRTPPRAPEYPQVDIRPAGGPR